MTMKKVGEAAKSVWAVYVIIAAMFAGIVWAGDGRYMQVADGGKMAVKIELTALQNRLDELIVQESFSKSAEQVQMIRALIKLKRSQIDALRNNPH